ncbi:hypothetical protein CsSME_00048062 [Camellia sinensis var. sinensis]
MRREIIMGAIINLIWRVLVLIPLPLYWIIAYCFKFLCCSSFFFLVGTPVYDNILHILLLIGVMLHVSESMCFMKSYIFVSLSQEAEKHLSEMVVSKALVAKIDRPMGIVCF